MNSSKSNPRTASSNLRSGGQILVGALQAQGTDTVFCVPGESYLAALDAFHDVADEVRLVVCRQEGGAAFMAEAYGKLTGRPGICFVTRGPGACNASVGIHMAYQDSTPVILFVGQVSRNDLEREGFQEMDFRRVFGQMAKWVVEIQDPARIPELVSRAFHTAISGRPGPVVVVLPEDVLTERTNASEVPHYRTPQAAPAPQDMAALRDMLAAAKYPLVIAGGGGGWSDAVKIALEDFADRNGLPVATAFRCQDYFDNTHPSYIGDLGIGMNPSLKRLFSGADLVLAVGTRFDEITTGGYTLLNLPRPSQKLIHISASPTELGKIYHADLPIVAGMEAFATAAQAIEPVDSTPWSGMLREARSEYETFSTPGKTSGAVDMASVMRRLAERLPDDAILTHGAGNYTAWPRRFYRYRRFGTQLGPNGGSMGYGVPAAVAAKIVHPDRVVISFNGDGCFQMNGQEIGTAVQYGLDPAFLVINNGIYGTIRMHQERAYPGRVSGTDIVNPDFAALGAAYGASGDTVQRTADFGRALERALNAGRASVIEIPLDAEIITPGTTLSEIRRKAIASTRK